MKYGIIYKITNKLNNKIYIGKTVQKFERRCKAHKYKSCSAFNNAIISHGWDNFTKEPFISALDESYLAELEEMTIKYFNSLAPSGYNLIEIDNGLNRYSQETKDKISESRKEYLKNRIEPMIAVNKKEHIFIDGVEYKECSDCKSVKLLSEYNVNNRRWDKLHFYCRECSKTKQTKYEKMSKEDFAKSYQGRQDVEKQKQFYIDNPEARAILSKQRSKAVIGTHVETGVEIEFASAKAASQFGFCNKGISKSIRFGHTHKNHTWRFKS